MDSSFYTMEKLLQLSRSFVTMPPAFPLF